MKHFIYTLKTGVIVFLTVCTTSCTSDFDNINTDPNNPTTATADLLLTPLLRNIVQSQFNYGDGPGLAHQIARTNYNEVEQYAFGTNEGIWNQYYLYLNSIQEMIRVSERDNCLSSKGIAYILKAFCIAQITDMWGDVPFFEATLGAENITPSYDTQKDIYTAEGGIIDLLKQADKLLEENIDVLPADIVYGGDRLKWRKLANSLRLRYLIRISNRIDDTNLNIPAEINSIMSLPLMETNDDNMLLPFLAGSPNKCPIYDMRAGNFEYTRMSDEMERMWTQYGDERVTVWFSPTTNSANTAIKEYAGIPSGCSSTTLTNIGYSQANVSMLGGYYRDTPDGCSAILMNCSEVKFLQAEAVIKGYAAGNAKQLYEDGITLSFEYYNKKDAITSYLQQTGIAFNSDNAMEQIMQQKWMSLFMVGYEAWFDFLRTGLPVQNQLLDNRNPSAPGEVPSRFYYPEDEQALNTANYQEAIKRQGGEDNINTKLWWEK